MSGGPGIVGVGETPALRHPEPGCDTATLIARAVRLALDDAGLRPADVDGLGLASFTLRPDRAIDMAWRLGLTLDWCMQDEMGGASAINLLRHAWLAPAARKSFSSFSTRGSCRIGANGYGVLAHPSVGSTPRFPRTR